MHKKIPVFTFCMCGSYDSWLNVVYLGGVWSMRNVGCEEKQKWKKMLLEPEEPIYTHVHQFISFLCSRWKGKCDSKNQSCVFDIFSVLAGHLVLLVFCLVPWTYVIHRYALHFVFRSSLFSILTLEIKDSWRLICKQARSSFPPGSDFFWHY